jgi:hypothetical protein
LHRETETEKLLEAQERQGTGREGKMGGQTGPTTDNADFMDDLDYTTSQPHASPSVSVKVPFFLSLFEFYPTLEAERSSGLYLEENPSGTAPLGNGGGGDGIPNHKKKRSHSVTLAGRHGVVLLSFFCVLHCVLFAGMRIL